MLLHLRPKMYAPGLDAKLLDLRIEPLGLHLRDGTDLATGRPYPNKGYKVARRRMGRKAVDGILIRTPDLIEEFRCSARWAVGAAYVAAHEVTYRVLDREFGAASDSRWLWHGRTRLTREEFYAAAALRQTCSQEEVDQAWAEHAKMPVWSSRFPEGTERVPPIKAEPRMDAWPGADKRKDDVLDENGFLLKRTECFSMPTIEPERILDGSDRDIRLPSIDTALSL